MRRRIIRILLFAALVIVLALGINFYLNQFTGDGKDTPEEALPDDAEYEWIEGPKSEKEQRYFFLSNGNYFGTGVVTKNFKGWSNGEGAYSSLPNPLDENLITAAYSDSKILFGLIKPVGEVTVTVNDQTAESLSFSSLSEEVIDLYNVRGYEIWYIDLSKLDDHENYLIKVFDENNSLINELSI